MTLRDRLADYQVTRVPDPVPARLGWLLPTVSDGDAADAPDGVGDALGLLRAYRITRVPVPAAS